MTCHSNGFDSSTSPAENPESVFLFSSFSWRMSRIAAWDFCAAMALGVEHGAGQWNFLASAAMGVDDDVGCERVDLSFRG